ncbi:hypothetical protein AUJ84_03745 [Candidatus Pacearchaeota archaeon CG1_02_32_132]|nr:MAG: hypothetical protein AUJ84_03745 [Candidatus Pacearchaeota archaeon CG1_02_32_132]
MSNSSEAVINSRNESLNGFERGYNKFVSILPDTPKTLEGVVLTSIGATAGAGIAALATYLPEGQISGPTISGLLGAISAKIMTGDKNFLGKTTSSIALLPGALVGCWIGQLSETLYGTPEGYIFSYLVSGVAGFGASISFGIMIDAVDGIMDYPISKFFNRGAKRSHERPSPRGIYRTATATALGAASFLAIDNQAREHFPNLYSPAAQVITAEPQKANEELYIKSGDEFVPYNISHEGKENQ